MHRALLVVGCAAFLITGCSSHDDDPEPSNLALSQACERVNLGIPNDRQQDKWAAYGESVSRWSGDADPATRAALEPVAARLQQFVESPHERRPHARAQWWDSFETLAQVCSENGSPMRP
jgi:hypothetical protein